MKDAETDTHLTQHLSGEPAREVFRQQVLRDSTAQFVRLYRRRCAWRRAATAAAAVVIAGAAFLGGRLSAPGALPDGTDVPPMATNEREGVNVPNELVAWLEAASLFRQLGMEDRMARAVERAGRLLPPDSLIAGGRAEGPFAAVSARNQTELVKPMVIPGPKPSADTISQILAHSFGD